MYVYYINVCVYYINVCVLYFSVSSRTSPKAQRPPQSNRPVRSQNTHSQTTGNSLSVSVCQCVCLSLSFSLSLSFLSLFLSLSLSFSLSQLKCFLFPLPAARSPKSGPSHDTPYLDTSSVQMPAHKTTGPAPLFPVDGKLRPVITGSQPLPGIFNNRTLI